MNGAAKADSIRTNMFELLDEDTDVDWWLMNVNGLLTRKRVSSGLAKAKGEKMTKEIRIIYLDGETEVFPCCHWIVDDSPAKVGADKGVALLHIARSRSEAGYHDWLFIPLTNVRYWEEWSAE